ncbi:DUF4013 domain-containing protein [Xanthomonas campestris pv. raphani]|uniref:DUF4013 domain-containing protein n=1 Tax=Xanthomonas campestris TaxID=339 RepID=UPI00021AFB2A|nr:DUF4013 domain-containing protein [Xanthomonas campestris]MEB2182571.1 DUF4013 domain-containing protein [Xanthomonas campestris pv. campestris]AEL07764.1 putative membrane protein [Xanthomonas campestris pv. raphani 756C]MEA9653763.1 DUF4013 domain-containing protein [Xanthomonas campestris pv. raphani]MEA9773871.1 DUF4013 domain-containing protein [Xanthomonas campestris pv. raphani]MEA9884607.1 DUF4013 domain-containing protein [Xanthomonas campestris pv. raphani]
MEDRFRARKVAAQAAPAPFWTRIPAIATYPLRGSALYALIALTLCSALLVLPGILKLVVLGVLGMATYTYAFDILRHSANGEHDAPRLGYNSFDSAVLRLILLAFALGIVIVAAGVIAGKPGLTIAYLAVQLLLPGMMIALAIDGSLRRALNPAVSIDMALRIGWPYLAAYGLLYVIQGSGTAAIFVALKYLPPVVRELTIVVASIWSLFASFHLMGYLVYQYHEELGYAPSGGVALQREDPDQRLLDEAEQFVRDGHSDEAFQALRGAVRSRAVSLAVHELYQRLLRQHHRNDELRDHTRQYINRLLQEKQERRALALQREALDTDPAFAPLLPEQATLLAERAKMAGQYQLATDGLLAAIGAWPRERMLPAWSLDAGLLLAERFGRDDDARMVLQNALDHCDDEAQRAKLAAALKAVAIQPA